MTYSALRRFWLRLSVQTPFIPLHYLGTNQCINISTQTLYNTLFITKTNDQYL
ncbi:hypothetical protein [Legionella pneumophila]|uniref:Uncharacterized protein n=2 Tax=Legionella pneumophila TaxID=446 RepID=A0AAN5M0B6_LEGPN|nr:hypothetical protein [Legionella pneumophila]MBG1729789.1 hypothetical protein [Legionella pneumophila]MCW8427465.1 hypothetical protein [Legionella pneumophila]MDW8879611.1 hypothetical protein [Legionella pneumophila subsp. fraseri]MDW8962620.1 hypothetical protein [Legionella pneumophila subsp. fraseri]MDW9036615.1 hypothetical protein [Legionella pneumophila subsp. fraseri]